MGARSRWLVAIVVSLGVLAGCELFAPDPGPVAAAPVLSPDAGDGPFAGPLAVAMSCATPGCGIWYTTDGSDPQPADGYGTPYLGVPVTVSATTTVKAAAWKEGMTPSVTAESTYVIDAPTAIDHEGDVGRYSAVAVAGSAVLVTYRDDTNRALKVARSTDGGASWATRFVDWVGDPGANASIAACGDLVAVAYQDAAAADLRCAVSTDAGASWRRCLVDPAGTAGVATAVAVGPTGVIHVAYHESVAGDLKYASSADGGASWTLRTLDASASDCGRHVSIAVNGSTVYVAYYDATAGDLRFGVLTGAGSWSSSALDTSGNVGQCPSLRWDPVSTTAWLAYHDVTGSRLKIARSVNGVSAWSTTGLANGGIVDDEGVTGLYASLAVAGSAGQHLAVAYYRDWDYRLVVSRSADGGGSWTTEEVGGEGLGQWASIAVTGEDAVTHAPTYAVSCYDSLARDLRLAAWDGAAWTVR